MQFLSRQSKPGRSSPKTKSSPQTSSHPNVWGIPGQYVSANSFNPVALSPGGPHVTSQQYVTSSQQYVTSSQHHPVPSVVSPAVQAPIQAGHPVQGLPMEFQRNMPPPRKNKVIDR